MQLQRSHGDIQTFEHKGLAATIGTDYKIDRPQLIPAEIDQRTEVLPAAGFNQGGLKTPYIISVEQGRC